MRFKSPNELEAAGDYLINMFDEPGYVDINKVAKKRTLSQNAYFHLLCGIFGLAFGSTTQQVKDSTVKKLLVPDFGIEIKQMPWGLSEELISSAKWTTVQMGIAIDRLILFAAEQEIELPLADNKDMIDYYSQQIENNKR